MRRLTIGCAVVLSCLTVGVARSDAVVVTSTNLAAFEAGLMDPQIVRNEFRVEAVAPGTDITGQTIGGVTFLGPGALLIVVRASDTFTPPGFTGVIDASTNKLIATSGQNVISPGGTTLGPGPNLAIENDDLTLVFSTPVRSLGFDLLSQSADGVSFVGIQVFDPSNALLFSGTIPISNLGGGGAPGGADFFGVVSDSFNIARVVIDDADGDNVFPDSNIGFDSFLFATPVPEPATMLLLASGFTGLGAVTLLRRRRRR